MGTHREGGISQTQNIVSKGHCDLYTSAGVATIFIRTAFGFLRARTAIASSASAVQGKCRARAIAAVLVHFDWPLLRTLLSVSPGPSWHSPSGQIRI
jgi:hypothetical protein